jgi:hypothetical protein
MKKIFFGAFVLLLFFSRIINANEACKQQCRDREVLCIEVATEIGDNIERRIDEMFPRASLETHMMIMGAIRRELLGYCTDRLLECLRRCETI